MKLLELQITQTRHPKSVVDGQSGPTTRPAFAKVTHVKAIPSQLLHFVQACYSLDNDQCFMSLFKTVSWSAVSSKAIILLMLIMPPL